MKEGMLNRYECFFRNNVTPLYLYVVWGHQSDFYEEEWLPDAQIKHYLK